MDEVSDVDALAAINAVRPLMLRSAEGGGHAREPVVLRAPWPALPPLRYDHPRPRPGRRQPHDLLVPDVPGLIRVGHKGADHVAPGNTAASFEAALEHGVDMIEFDVLRARDGRLVLAHDYADSERRECLTLEEGLELFAGEAYAGVELDVDLKLPGTSARWWTGCPGTASRSARSCRRCTPRASTAWESSKAPCGADGRCRACSATT